jgi:hypothetical protein
VGLDSDGQLLCKAFNARQNFQKAMDEPLGLCKGLTADRVLNNVEITYLSDWLRSRSELCQAWPANVISKRVRDVLSDGLITEEERADLQEFLLRATGDPPQADSIARFATRLPIDLPEPLVEVKR